MATSSLGRLTLDLVAKTGGFTGPIERAERNSRRSMRRMQRNAQDAAAGIAKITAAAAAATTGLYLFAKAGMDNIDAYAKLARQLDTNIGEYRGIELAATDAGVSQQKLERAMKSYSKRLGDATRGTGEAKKAYAELGLEADKIARMPLSEQMATLADEIGKLDTAAARTSIADKLMSGGRDVVKLFDSGSDSIRAAVDEAAAFGLALDAVDVANIESANDSIKRTGFAFEGLQNSVAVKLAPSLEDLANNINKVTKAFHAGRYDDQVALLSRVSQMAAAAGAAYLTYRSAVAAATIAQYAFNVAIRANPLGIIVTAATTAVGAVFAFREELGFTAGAAGRAEDALDGATGAIRSGSLAAIDNSYDALTDSLDGVRQTAQEATLAVLELEKSRSFYEKSGSAAAGGATAEIARQHKLQSEAWEQMAEIVKKREDLAERRKKIEEEMASAGGARGGSVETPAMATAAGTRAIEKQNTALQSLMDTLYPYEAAQQQARREQLLLQTAFTDGTIGIERYLDAFQRLETSKKNSGSWQDVYDSIGSVNEQLDNSNTFAEKFGGTMSSALEDAIVDFESFGDVAKGVLEDIQRMLVRQSITDPLANAIGGADWGGMIGGLFSGGSGGGAGSFSGSTGGLYSAVGQAHSGIDRVPKSGTWNLEKGERVVTADTSTRLDATLDAVARSGTGGNTTVQVIDQRSGGEKAEVQETRGADGMKRVRVMIRDEQKAAMSDGSMDSTMSRNYGVRRRSL